MDGLGVSSVLLPGPTCAVSWRTGFRSRLVWLVTGLPAAPGLVLPVELGAAGKHLAAEFVLAAEFLRYRPAISAPCRAWTQRSERRAEPPPL